MSEVKHRCGQCEYYLNQRDKCPHQENIATHKGCEIFKYTNPEGRIDGLISIIKSLEQENEHLVSVVESTRQDYADLLDGSMEAKLKEARDWLLEEYHFLSIKMTAINNIVQPLWNELRERRGDCQLIEKFIEQIQKEGLEQALKGESDG